jgi:hypothetical protein
MLVLPGKFTAYNINTNEMGEACSTYTEDKTNNILNGDNWRTEQVKRRRQTWEDNIEMDLTGIGLRPWGS